MELKEHTPRLKGVLILDCSSLHFLRNLHNVLWILAKGKFIRKAHGILRDVTSDLGYRDWKTFLEMVSKALR